MPSSLISLGANLGNVLETMRSAGRLLREAFQDSSVTFSRMFRTPAVGGPTGQGEFLNAMVRVDHSRSLWDVWNVIQRIETDLGRQRNQRWESRRIDIDLILHDSVRLWTPHLKIPHPRMCMRSFVLQPALEIASEFIDPVSRWSIRQLAEHLDHVNSTGSAPSIAIGCNLLSVQEGLQTTFDALGQDWSNYVTLTTTTHPWDWILAMKTSGAECNQLGRRRVDLRIACVKTPDPESVQWEDYSAPWAVMLGLQPAARQSGQIDGELLEPIAGPRYLLPGNDLPWAVHEILAAGQAMRCPVEPTDNSWGF
jgi:2-amino-4-hydroxy-6-hydroxymethyldihydropteridine diphosphokinase